MPGKDGPTYAYGNNGMHLGPGDNGETRNNHADAMNTFSSDRIILRRGAYTQPGRLKRIFMPLSILLIEMFERIAYILIVAGIYKFSVVTLRYNALDSGLLLLGIVTCGAYVLAPFGGLAADAFLGRFWCIMLSALIHIIGLTMFIVVSIDPDLLNLDFLDLNLRVKNYIMLSSLSLIALGSGGIKANVPPFGADQISALGEDSVTTYFHLYYLVLNIGCVAAVACSGMLQTEEYLGTSLLVPLGGMCLSLFIFALLHAKYVREKPEGQLVKGCCSICCQTCCKDSAYDGEDVMFSRAMYSYGGKTPDHVVVGFSSAIKASIFFIFLVVVWVGIGLAVTTLPIYQAERMNPYVGGFLIPEWIITSTHYQAIVVCLIAITLGIIPMFRCCKRPLTVLKRLGIGMALVVLGLFASGVVEWQRKVEINSNAFTVSSQEMSPQFQEEVVRYLNIMQRQGKNFTAPSPTANFDRTPFFPGDRSAFDRPSGRPDGRTLPSRPRPFTGSVEEFQSTAAATQPVESGGTGGNFHSDGISEAPHQTGSTKGVQPRQTGSTEGVQPDETTVPPPPNQDTSPSAPNQDTSPSAPNQDTSPSAPNQDTSPSAPNQDTSPPAPNQDTSPSAPSEDTTLPDSTEFEGVSSDSQSLTTAFSSNETANDTAGVSNATFQGLTGDEDTELSENNAPSAESAFPKELLPYIQKLANDPPNGFAVWKLKTQTLVSNMSVLLQLPSYMLLGAGESFATVACLEMAYDQAPFAYQGLLTGLFVMSIGVGSLVASQLLTSVEGLTVPLSTGAWFSITTDINDAHLDYVFYAVGGVVALFFILFLVISIRCYTYTEPMTFAEVEEPEIPGFELKSAAEIEKNKNQEPEFKVTVRPLAD